MKTSNLCVRRENATERVTISFIFQLIDLKVSVFLYLSGQSKAKPMQFRIIFENVTKHFVCLVDQLLQWDY